MRVMSHSQPRPCSGMKTLKRCKNNGEADNVILIDVDSDSFNNVIIIDVPESLTKKLRGSSGSKKDKTCPLRSYIYIDDDESSDNHRPGTCVGDDGKFNSGASSSMRHGSATNHSRYKVDGDQYHFAQENMSPVKLSKCKRTYSGKASNNRYGFTTDSDSDSSDNDGPDCEFMEDSSGQLREQWEKASLKRKSDVHNNQSGGRDHGGASRFSTDVREDVGADNETEKYPDAAVGSDPRKVSHEKEDEAPVARAEGKLGGTSCDPKKPPFANTDLNSMQKTQIHHKNSDIHAQGESLMEVHSCCNFEQQTCKHCEHGGSGLCNDEAQSHQGNGQVNSQHEDRVPQAETSSLDSEPSGDVNVCHSKASLPVDKASSFQGQCSGENKGDHGEFVCGDVGEKCEQAGEENKACLESCLESVSNCHEEDERNDLLHAPDSDAVPVESCIINEREKLKETDEYKRALEEEWLSRQRALKIQAEEAQELRRLRKRRKAESLRLLDMERRQKQRVEEIRETQKKDEENMNLKELHRTEVRKELSKLEIMCGDMASLLRGLGIQVGSGPHPLPHEVRAAYKRALLSFHPDRASGSDMRQQVEAEEKFKLISRIKEKFLPTS